MKFLIMCIAMFSVAAWAAEEPKKYDDMSNLNFRNQQEKKFDSKGRLIETIDTNRKLDFSESGMGNFGSKEYRAKLAEDKRLEKVKKACGEWFEAIQLLEADENTTDKAGYDVTQIVTDNSKIRKSGGGILAYITAAKIFKVNATRHTEGVEAQQLKAALDEMLYRKGGEVVIGPGHGVSIAYPMELLLVRYQSWKAQRTPVDEVRPAKSADLWPGAVPKSAERVTKKITLLPGIGGWRSTGLYVPPGEIVTITTSGIKGSLRAQIGCHTDGLPEQILAIDDETGKPDKEIPINLAKVKMGWQKVTDNRALWRWPECTRSFNINRPREEIAFALGGILYFIWNGGGDKPLTIEVSGCVEMPYFRLGIDDDEKWVNELRDKPAPWAELATKNVIITVQSKHVRKITQMTALAQWWGKAIAIQHRLAGRRLATDGESPLLRKEAVHYSVNELGKLVSDGIPDAEILVRLSKVKAKQDQSNPSGPVAQAQQVHPGLVDPSAYTNNYEFFTQANTDKKTLKPLYLENEYLPTPDRIVDDTQISAGAGHSGYPVMCMSWGSGMMDLNGLQRHGSCGAMHEIGHNMGQGRNGIYALPGNGEVICNVYGCAVMNLVNGTSLRKICAGNWNNVAKSIYKTKDYWSKADVFDRLVFYLTLADYFGWQTYLAAVNDSYDKYQTEAVGDRMCCCFSNIVKRDLTPYFKLWGLPLSAGTYTYTGKWPPWPTDDEMKTLFDKPISTKSANDTSAEDDNLRIVSSPEDVPTRRQLRAQPKLKKVSELEAERAAKAAEEAEL